MNRRRFFSALLVPAVLVRPERSDDRGELRVANDEWKFEATIAWDRAKGVVTATFSDDHGKETVTRFRIVG